MKIIKSRKRVSYSAAVKWETNAAGIDLSRLAAAACHTDTHGVGDVSTYEKIFVFGR